MRRSVPASTARDALTHITGKNEASGAMQGKRAEAGVIHRGRNGLGSSGSAYDESCACTLGGEANGDRSVRAARNLLRELRPRYRAALLFGRAREG
jgi:hypothetical protein